MAPTKKTHQKGSAPASTLIAEKRVHAHRVKGGQAKNKVLAMDVVNVFDEKAKKHVQAKITSVVENPANRHFIRRNIMTKGAIVETSAGKVQITNRPGQEGSVQGVFVTE